MNSQEIIHLLIFNSVTNYTPKQKLDLYNNYKSAEEIFLRRIEAEGIFQKPFKIGGVFLDLKRERSRAEQEFLYYKKNDIFIIDINDDFFPIRLKYIYDPPLVLFVRGKKDLLKAENTIGIVGARKPSNSSINGAYSISRELSKADFVVVSGLATGIDYYAHRGALDGKGNTIAVLGNGIDIRYPRSSAEVYELIGKNGLLVTEFPLSTPPLKYNFPKRNRIISGLSLGVVIVEASQNSGALITSMYALEQGREVMAFPGRAGSESFSGNNRLIKEGAHLVESTLDILNILGKGYVYEKEQVNLKYSPLEKDILKTIGDDSVSIEEIERILENPISKISSALMMLELKGVVLQHPGKIFSRI